MLFKEEDRDLLKQCFDNIFNVYKKLNEYQYFHDARHKEIVERTAENIKKVNEMTLEVKGIIATQRSYISQNNVPNDFVVVSKDHLKEINDKIDSLDKSVNKILKSLEVKNNSKNKKKP